MLRPSRWPRGAWAPSLLCCAALTLGAGCGGSDEDLTDELTAARGRALQVIDAEEVASQPAGSPERVVMAIWRALQYRDVQRAFSLVTPVAPEERLLMEKFFLRAEAAIANSRPDIKEVTLLGTRAVVAFDIVTNEGLGGQNLRQTRRGAVLVLVDMGGRWRALLSSLLDAVRPRSEE